jgi:hypothetical protein
MKIGLFVDRMKLAVWQARALEALGSSHDFFIYNCLNTGGGRRRLKHVFYYLLNLFTIRNPLTRHLPLSGPHFETGSRCDFEAEQDGNWQRLPERLLERIRDDRPDVILKFGLSLLRIPERDALAAPILSYHHGDPRHFRGRPAGFWELLQGAPSVGQIVQVLSNRLDAGAVVAFAETKVRPHSYRQTLIELYRHSPLILGRAIQNALSGRPLAIEPKGRNYRLPRNLTVAAFVLRLWWQALRRLLYGLFVEKAWSVSTCRIDPRAVLGAGGDPRLPEARNWATLATPPGYTFVADPFFDPASGAILIEALNGRTGAGEILRVSERGETHRLTTPGRHASYPSAFAWMGETYLVPEMCEWSKLHLYRLDSSSLTDLGEVDLDPPRRLIDPTPFEHDGRLYLFANDAAEGPEALRLWVGGGPFGPFREHPASPILVSPRGGRMAGQLVRTDGRLYRLGQNGAGAYGDGIIIFEVEAFGPDAYLEKPAGALRFGRPKGPHTLNFRAGEAVFDWYRDRLSLLAGVRRLFGRLARG